MIRHARRAFLPSLFLVFLMALLPPAALAQSGPQPTSPWRLGINMEDAQNGVRVVGVTPGSMAAEQRMIPGDLIFAGGYSFTPQGPEDVVEAVRTYPGQGHILFMMVRDGNRLFFAARPYAVGEGENKRYALGMGVSKPDPDTPLTVTQVVPLNAAAELGIQVGDQIIGLAPLAKPVRGQDIIDLVSNYSGEGSIALLTRRGGETTLFNLQPRNMNAPSENASSSRTLAQTRQEIAETQAEIERLEAEIAAGEQQLAITNVGLAVHAHHDGKYAEARRYFAGACLKDIGIACSHLATYLQQGWGGPADPVLAPGACARACTLDSQYACPAAGAGSAISDAQLQALLGAIDPDLDTFAKAWGLDMTGDDLVSVTAVTPGSLADQHGITPGTLILRTDGKSVHGAEEVSTRKGVKRVTINKDGESAILYFTATRLEKGCQ